MATKRAGRHDCFISRYRLVLSLLSWIRQALDCSMGSLDFENLVWTVVRQVTLTLTVVTQWAKNGSFRHLFVLLYRRYEATIKGIMTEWSTSWKMDDKGSTYIWYKILESICTVSSNQFWNPIVSERIISLNFVKIARIWFIGTNHTRDTQLRRNTFFGLRSPSWTLLRYIRRLNEPQ